MPPSGWLHRLSFLPAQSFPRGQDNPAVSDESDWQRAVREKKKETQEESSHCPSRHKSPPALTRSSADTSSSETNCPVVHNTSLEAGAPGACVFCKEPWSLHVKCGPPGRYNNSFSSSPGYPSKSSSLVSPLTGGGGVRRFLANGWRSISERCLSPPESRCSRDALAAPGPVTARLRPAPNERNALRAQICAARIASFSKTFTLNRETSEIGQSFNPNFKKKA